METIFCPGVMCNCACESCGFNPWEQKRRLEEGHFQTAYINHVLHDDNNCVVHVARKLCKYLVFKKGVSKNV